MMRDWPLPTNPKELKGFLGLMGYYCQFVQGYGKITTPLTKLLKKDAILWTEEAIEVIQRLKDTMLSVPLLSLSNFGGSLILKNDASCTRLGAVLSQKDRPIAFLSQALTKKGRQRPLYERELMVIVFTIQK